MSVLFVTVLLSLALSLGFLLLFALEGSKRPGTIDRSRESLLPLADDTKSSKDNK